MLLFSCTPTKEYNVAFQTLHGKYVCADAIKKDFLIADRDNIGEWEEFRINEYTNTVSIISYKNLFVGVNNLNLLQAKHESESKKTQLKIYRKGDYAILTDYKNNFISLNKNGILSVTSNKNNAAIFIVHTIEKGHEKNQSISTYKSKLIIYVVLLFLGCCLFFYRKLLKQVFIDWFWFKLLFCIITYYIAQYFNLVFNHTLLIIFVGILLMVVLPKSFKHLTFSYLTVLWLYIYAIIISNNSITEDQLLSTLSLIIAFSFTSYSLYHLFHNYKYVGAILFIILLYISFIIPFSFIVYYKSFGVALNKEQLYAIYQSNSTESIDYITQFIAKKWLIIAGLVFTAITIIAWKLKNKATRLLISKTSSLLLISLALFYYSYSFNPNPIINLISSSLSEYKQELKNFKKYLNDEIAKDINFTASKPKGNELYVVVIGESLNKNHMSLYGYYRNTTPNLNQLEKNGDIIKLNNAFSCHTHTLEVLTKALSYSSQYNSVNYYESPTIIDVFNKAGFKTYWLSNQVKYGGWDSPVSAIAERAHKSIFINKNMGEVTATNSYDIALEKQLKQIIDKGIEQNTVVFVHLMGNHGAYKDRYPNNFNIYKDTLHTFNVGNKNFWHSNINEYDNSVIYNDFVVNQLIKQVKKYKSTSALIYFADHAEDVLDNKGHNSGQFSYSMVQVPFIFYFNNKYKTQYPNQYKNINKNINKVFTNDLLFDMLVGLTHVKTNFYTPTADLTHNKYNLSIKNALSKNSKKKLLTEENYYYTQAQNIHKIDSLKQLNRIIPHRVNSLGKLAEVFYNGYSCFEIDVKYNTKSNTFQVGHDSKSMAGISFEQFLKTAQLDSITKIWLDLKNLKTTNFKAIKTRLLQLDSIFNLKPYLTVETSYTNNNLKEISDEGFYTSYYLPTHIKDETNKNKLLQHINNIKKQIKTQKLSAISFDYRLYAIIKPHFYNHNIDFHLWDLSKHYANPSLLQSLLQENYYKDDKVKTILIPYRSNYEL